MQAQQRSTLRRQPRYPAEAEAVFARLRNNATRYFSELAGGPIDITLSRTQCHKMSAVFEFNVVGSRCRRTVIAKVNRVRRDEARVANQEGRSALDRPRLAPWIPREVSARMEYDALRVIHSHFTRLGEDRFLPVRALDLLPEGPVIVMEKLPLENLKSLFVRYHRTRGAADHSSMLQACHNAGAWLRHFHRFPPLPHTRTRRRRREDFVSTVQAFAKFLIENHGHAGFFGSVATVVEQRAAEVLPDRLPLGVLHGDYGARNVLADEAGTVAGLDTRARCFGPVYEDLGYFLVMLHKDSPYFYSPRFRDRSRAVEQFGDAFLRGYFDDAAVPREAIRLFEVEALLDKWAPYTLGYREATGVRRLAKRCRLEVLSRFFLRRLRHLIGEIRRPAPPSLQGDHHVATTEIR